MEVLQCRKLRHNRALQTCDIASSSFSAVQAGGASGGTPALEAAAQSGPSNTTIVSSPFFPLFRLVALVEVLQRRKLRHNRAPQTQPHALENITIALDAIQEDGIKLVNIGN